MKKQGKIKYFGNILWACIGFVIVKPMKWFQALIAKVTRDAESLSSLGSVKELGVPNPYPDEELKKRLDDQANGLVLLMGEINKLNSEVAVLKKQLQDSNSDNSSSENED